MLSDIVFSVYEWSKCAFAQHALLVMEGLIEKMTNIYPLNPRFMLPFVFVLALSLLFLLPSGLAQAQQSEEFFTYAENGTGPVATFTASDPEGATPIVWSLAMGAVDLNDNGSTTDPGELAVAANDEGDFNISQDGALTFKSSPDFEAPAGGGPDNDSNTYQVVVQASDGSEADYFKATVTVTDVEEAGKVTLNVTPSSGEDPVPGLRQFRSGALLTAVVTDLDGPPDGVNLTEGNFAPSPGTIITWYRSSSRSATGTQIGTDSTYTVDDDDVGNYIRVVAAYRDVNGHTDGSNRREEVSFVSAYPVQVAPGDLTLLNAAPAFGVTAASRRVAENSKGNIGAPITATDANNGDKLTYTIAVSADIDAQLADVNLFSIDPATGQLMVAMAQGFNGGNEGSGTDNVYVVEVHATDSSGEPAPTAVTVKVTVTNVDEGPFFDANLMDNTNTAISPLIMAVEHRENKNETENDPTSDITLVIGTYSARDPEGAKVTLSLMGRDASSFKLDADIAAIENDVTQVLSFKENPDYEMPGDQNRDNVYEVTVRASDGGLNTDYKLIVKVINQPELPKVELSSKAAQVGVELTATLTDPEGGNPARLTDQKWTWHNDGGVNTAEFIPSDANAISGATSSTYTPASAYTGDYLKAMVTYTGGTTPFTVSDATDIVQDNPGNLAPKFKEGTSTSRSIPENSDADAAVGNVVTVTDANDDTLTYTLGGADASSFKVSRTEDGQPQLEVKSGTKLDHEAKASYTVTLTANDGSGASNNSARITVTIMVTDDDEMPTIKDRSDAAAIVQQAVTYNYKENGTGSVATFTASDPEGATPVVWSLTADTNIADISEADIADRALFNISQGGVLTFKSSPDFEGASNSSDDDYLVVVEASDGNNIDRVEVTVSVTDVEETGKVTWTVVPSNIGLLQFRSGASLTAVVTDPDRATSTSPGETITPSVITWYRSSSRSATGTEILGTTGSTYPVVPDDVGNYIRVVASYDDTNGHPDGSNRSEEVSFVSDYQVLPSTPSTNMAPGFGVTELSRRIAENSKGNLGDPITATDANSGDKLTYSKTGDSDNRFNIDPATGQLSLRTAQAFNGGTDGNEGTAATNDYVVMVQATDSSGVPTDDDVEVTVTVTNVDEGPFFTAALNTNTQISPLIMTVEHSENKGINPTDGTGTLVLMVGTTPYSAKDPEGAEVTLSLTGNDASLFELGDDTATTNDDPDVMQVLSFKENPDYEMPGDQNRDNVYEVTVRASDGGLNTDYKLIVKVINQPELPKVELSSKAAQVGVELTATLTDPEGGNPARFTNQMWTWHSDSAATFTASEQNAIGGATSSTYTPTSDDTDDYLRAMVTYTGGSAVSDATNAVQSNPGNLAPKFKEGTSTSRSIAENAKPNAAADDDDTSDVDERIQGNVGSPITVTDANGDTLTYTLGGADASSFKVSRTDGQPQLEVKSGTKLDHETKASYTVTMTADDGSAESNSSATITVTIMVTDVDEMPTIMLSGASVPAVTVSFGSATYTAAEGDSVTVMVTLSAAPRRSVSIPITKSNQGTTTNADYSGVPASVTFGASEMSKTFSFTATDDTDDDDGESVRLSFGTLPTGVSRGTPGTTTVNITDDDDPAMRVRFSQGAYSVTEGSDVIVMVTLSAAPEGTVIIPLTKTNQSGASDADYSGVPANVTFNSGETSQTFSFTAVDDTDDDDGESVRLGFGTLPTGVSAGTASTATVSITDNDGDEMSTVGSLLDRYDDDDSGHIDRAEAVRAVLDYQGGQLTRAEAVQVILLYQAGPQ